MEQLEDQDQMVMLELLVHQEKMVRTELPVDLDLRVMLEPLVHPELVKMALLVQQVQLDQLDQPV